jgi:hypothetical protein
MKEETICDHAVLITFAQKDFFPQHMNIATKIHAA